MDSTVTDGIEEVSLKCKMLHSNMRAMEMAIFSPGPRALQEYELGYDLLIDYVIEIKNDLEKLIRHLYGREAV